MSKVMLSTDIGSDIDDALALLIMLNHQEIDLKEIITVNGDIDSRSYIAKRMIDLSGQDVIVAKGISKPIFSTVEPYSKHEDYLVDESFLDEEKMELEGDREIFLLSTKEVGIKDNGVLVMADVLRKEKRTIVSIGPLTCIAELIKCYSDVIGNIEQLYIMGARFPEGNLEHNFRFDTGAVDIVLSSDIPITIVSGDLCQRYRLPINYTDLKYKSKAGKYVLRMLKSFFLGRLTDNFNFKHFEYTPLLSLINNEFRMSNLTSMSYDEWEKLRVVLINFQSWLAYLEPEEIWQDFNLVIELLSKVKNNEGEKYLNTFLSLLPENISISDVYLPYCLLHPEKIKTKKMVIDCDVDGRTIVLSGEKHDVVVDIDIEHFKKFVHKYLY